MSEPFEIFTDRCHALARRRDHDMTHAAPTTVKELWRYPVKSMGGEQLTKVDVTPHGLVGDRRWGLKDKETGFFLTARCEPKLLMARATISEGGQLAILLGDGTTTNSAAVLSDWLGRPVSLDRADAEEATYESAKDAANDTDWYTWTGPGTALHDEPFARVSLVSTTSLGTWDVRRIRSNIVVSGGGEDDLVGANVRIGTATFDVMDRISRCVMVTRPQPGLVRDLDVLKTINRKHNGQLSVGALVAKPGTVVVGDPIVIGGPGSAPQVRPSTQT